MWRSFSAFSRADGAAIRTDIGSSRTGTVAGNIQQATNDSFSATRNIVLTGGPCGGKSTALNHLKESLQAEGFDVYTVPEVPTILILGGAEYGQSHCYNITRSSSHTRIVLVAMWKCCLPIL